MTFSLRNSEILKYFLWVIRVFHNLGAISMSHGVFLKYLLWVPGFISFVCFVVVNWHKTNTTNDYFCGSRIKTVTAEMNFSSNKYIFLDIFKIYIYSFQAVNHMHFIFFPKPILLLEKLAFWVYIFGKYFSSCIYLWLLSS